MKLCKKCDDAVLSIKSLDYDPREDPENDMKNSVPESQCEFPVHAELNRVKRALFLKAMGDAGVEHYMRNKIYGKMDEFQEKGT
jgi:hypothetical protein